MIIASHLIVQKEENERCFNFDRITTSVSHFVTLKRLAQIHQRSLFCLFHTGDNQRTLPTEPVIICLSHGGAFSFIRRLIWPLVPSPYFSFGRNAGNMFITLRLSPEERRSSRCFFVFCEVLAKKEGETMCLYLDTRLYMGLRTG